jgi:hypothetical protein
MASVLVLLTMFACAGMKSFEHDEKYNLDDQLEAVTEIHKFTMRSWEKVDRQSFVLQSGAGTYYLIVLVRPSTELMFTETVKISNTGSSVKPGFDTVTVYQSGKAEEYVINKIYKFKDYDQVKEIEAQLTGK